MGAENRVENMRENEYASLGSYINFVFGIPFGLVALLTLRPLLTSLFLSGFVNWSSLAGLKKQDLRATPTISITVGIGGSVTGSTESPDSLQGLRLSQSLRKRSPLG